MSFQIPALISKDESALNKAYIRKRPVSRIQMICQDIQPERKWLNILLMATHRYEKVLNRELTTVAKEEKFPRSIEEALMKQ